MTTDWFLLQRNREHEEGEAPFSRPARVERLPRGVRTTTDRNTPPPTAARGEQWIPMGPSVALFGQVAARPRVAGRVRALAVSTDGSRIYAGTANGGVWFSPDAGATWRPLDFYASTHDAAGNLDDASALSVGALLVNFNTLASDADDEVFVGTGESSASRSQNLPTSALTGVGIRRATNPVGAVATNPANDNWTLEATNLAGAAIYRLVRFPHSTGNTTPTVWAATSRGLYRRPLVAPFTEWEQMESTFHTDVVVATPTAGPPTLYAARFDGLLKLYQSPDGVTWNDVVLPEFPAGPPPGPPTAAREPVGRFALAAATGVPPVVYALSNGGRLWRITGTSAAQVAGLPVDLFGEYNSNAPNTGTQAWRDMAIAVNPLNSAEVIVGGSWAYYPNAASLFRAVITGASPNFTFPTGVGIGGAVLPPNPRPRNVHFTGVPVAAFVGEGVHADVHALAWVPGGGTSPTSHVIVGCDGGVFRSTAGAAARSWVARNTGLSVLECTFLAVHPTSEALMLVGAQDNGVLMAASPEAWMVVAMGDGGGVALDPADPRRMLGQYIRGQWRRSLDGITFQDIHLFRAPASATAGATAAAAAAVVQTYTNAEDAENAASAFYSGAAVIRPVGGPTQLVVGTRRVWFSEDWGGTWRTLPSFIDPSVPATGTTGPRTSLDVFASEEHVIQLRWADSETLLVLTNTRIHVMKRTSNVRPAGGAPPQQTWTQHTISDPAHAQKKEKDYDGIIPPYMPLTDIAVHRAPTSTQAHPTMYATTGRSGRDAAERHVWWFDGNNRWVDCGLTFNGPAYAVVADTQVTTQDTVFVGTSIGVWKGRFVAPAAGQRDPTWNWSHYADGLPEAPVADLQIQPSSGVLRAALAGRGVWEIPLPRLGDLGFAQGAEAYVRAHAHDRRRQPVAVDVRDPFPVLGTAEPYGPNAYPTLRLDASPDIRVRRAPGSPQAPVPPFSATPPGIYAAQRAATTRTFDTFAIQSALRAGGTNTNIHGLDDWDHGVAVQRFNGGGNAAITPAQWTALTGGANGNVYPFELRDGAGQPLPDHADANVVFLDEPVRGTPPAHSASCATGSGPVRIDVVVHGRDWRTIAANRVSVALLRIANPASLLAGPVPQLPAGWATALLADRTAPPGAGVVPAWLGADWRYVDTTRIRPLPGPLTAAAAQVVTFEADLSAPAWPANGWLLAAIILADDDPIPAPLAAVRDVLRLARESRHFALRSVGP